MLTFHILIAVCSSLF